MGYSPRNVDAHTHGHQPSTEFARRSSATRAQHTYTKGNEPDDVLLRRRRQRRRLLLLLLLRKAARDVSEPTSQPACMPPRGTSTTTKRARVRESERVRSAFHLFSKQALDGP